MSDEERFTRLEHSATEARKMLFGVLVLAKEVWGDDLLQRAEGIEIVQEMEKAEESFTDLSLPDRLKRFEQTINVINQRAKSLFDLMMYVSKYRKHS